MLLVCGAALWKGGPEERLAGAALLLNTAVTLVLRDFALPFEAGGFAADIATLLLLGVVALRSIKFWPMFAAAFQLLGVMTHVAKIIDPAVRPWAYYTAIVIWTYLIYIALGVGTLNAWRERRLAPSRARPRAGP